MSQGNKRGENLEPIPTDLITETLSRLPAKSISRFHFMSKLWESILDRPYFTELFLTRSRARPRLLFAVKGKTRSQGRLKSEGACSFYSSPQPHNPYENSSVEVAADFHTKFRGDFCSYAFGLVYFSDMLVSEKTTPMVCNPSTGQYTVLPELIMSQGDSFSFLGFDPIDKQFKVLYYCLCDTYHGHTIMTLGNGELMWTKIQCSIVHKPLSKGICINGILYYLSRTDILVCLNVRSEKFNFIQVDCFGDPGKFKLINFKGKLGAVSTMRAMVYRFRFTVWVLEDAEKQEWSKYDYSLPEIKNYELVTVVGMTARGEFVLATKYTFESSYVFYFNPERNTLQAVEIEGFETSIHAYGFGSVNIFVDHIEDFNF